MSTLPADNHLSLVDALNLYASTYVAARNFAPRSRTEYSHDLSELVAFLNGMGIGHAHELGLAPLQAFQADLDRRGLAGATRRRKTAAIRSFLRFLHQQGHVTSDLASRLIPPRAETSDPRVLAKHEYQRLLAVVADDPRDTAIVEVLLQTGLRLSELAQLTLDDIQLPAEISPDPENVGYLTVRVGRGHKRRTIPLNHKVCRALHTYLEVRPDVPGRALFVSRLHRALGPRGLQKLMEKYLAVAGIAEASVHSLRHTFATHHVARGTSLRTVQIALGHESIATTSVYVSLARDLMRDELQANAL